MLRYFYRIIERITIIRAFSVILSLNKPINSILCLVVAVTGLRIMAILIGCTFVGIIFLVIYIGAIAVLFLFIVMMLDLNYDYIKNEKIKILLSNVTLIKMRIIYIIGAILTEIPYYLYELTLIPTLNEGHLLKAEIILKDTYYENWLENRIQSKENINLIGTILYDYYRHLVISSGLVLLIAMVGSIIITLKK